MIEFQNPNLHLLDLNFTVGEWDRCRICVPSDFGIGVVVEDKVWVEQVTFWSECACETHLNYKYD